MNLLFRNVREKVKSEGLASLQDPEFSVSELPALEGTGQ